MVQVHLYFYFPDELVDDFFFDQGGFFYDFEGTNETAIFLLGQEDLPVFTVTNVFYQKKIVQGDCALRLGQLVGNKIVNRRLLQPLLLRVLFLLL